MHLTEYTRNADAPDRARRRIQYRGATPNGDPVWTDAEDAICKQYGSNNEALRQKLPHAATLQLFVAIHSTIVMYCNFKLSLCMQR
ncbi:hypothetical protein M2281_000159 [Mesorhizobium soli]|uniref:hypothetical protein n=1 Tax=Pseudaminobacter soli (ex Li et al. 2025) TaxID=1295366 RepID=UPI002473BC9F|nr:hypothetical protein [Mesorhizobium soli]MDH6229587.1 hypothetical protein [Mesorhizobium soli]